MGDKIEVTANNGMTSYYGITFLMFIALSVNCAIFFSSYSSIQCIAEDAGPVPGITDGEEEAVDADTAERRRALEFLDKDNTVANEGEQKSQRLWETL